MKKQCKCGRYKHDLSKDLCAICFWDQETANQEQQLNFITVDTVRLPQSGNVSKARIEMIKRRVLHPDGKGEVVLKNHAGKITSRSADDY